MNAVAVQLAPRRSLARIGLRRFARRPVAVTALVLLVGILLAGAFAHVLVGDGWSTIDLDNVKGAPSLAHPFGTDNVGRDVLQRTVYGIRSTELVALAGAGIATLVGVIGGALAGYYGGWLDAVVMRLADLVTAYPAVVFTLAAIVYFRPVWPHTLIVVFSSFMWAIVARVVRADFVRLRESEFVEAARALGASDARILVRHLLPNTSGTILVAATSLIGQIVLVDATVEFFGFGIPEAVAPSLGNLVADVVKFKFGLASNTDVAALQFGWWTWFFPGLVLVTILVCVNLVGDALDAALNPSATRG
jgi:ABC-type dipeptide/oligopeptide/nickel transport system permease subunit